MFGISNAKIAALAAGLLLAAIGTHLGGLEVARDVALVIASVVTGVPTVVKAFKALRHRAFSIDLLVTIAVVPKCTFRTRVHATSAPTS